MKFFLSLIMGLGLLGCGLVCESEPPRYAEYIEGGGHGMVYHFKLYDPRGDAGHTPGRCTKYTYISTDLYADDLGNLSADEVIWLDLRGNNAYPEEERHKLKIYLSNDKVIISGHTGDYVELNGEYPIK